MKEIRSEVRADRSSATRTATISFVFGTGADDAATPLGRTSEALRDAAKMKEIAAEQVP